MGLRGRPSPRCSHHSAVAQTDWKAARGWVAGQAHPDDLVVFAPRWTDPIGRETFGPSSATLSREARADETRFPRPFEVPIRGARLPAFAQWKRLGERRFGGITVTTWENPAPAHVIDDLVSMDPRRMRVERNDAACPLVPNRAIGRGVR